MRIVNELEQTEMQAPIKLRAEVVEAGGIFGRETVPARKHRGLPEIDAVLGQGSNLWQILDAHGLGNS